MYMSLIDFLQVWTNGKRVARPLRHGVQGLGYCRPKGPSIEQAFQERSCRDPCGIQVNDPSVQQLDTWGLGNGTRSSLVVGGFRALEHLFM